MAGYPKRPEEIFDAFSGDVKAVFGDDLVGILLYGSAAGGDYRPGRSDLNFLIVLTRNGIDRLDEAFDVVRQWGKRRVAVPLFVTEPYVLGSLDVFPIEYLDMQRRHVCIYGRDILKGVVFDPEHVRLQCEREIKGKLLLLREGFLKTAGHGGKLKDLIAASLPAFGAIFEALLFLKGRDIPKTKRAVLQTGCAMLQLDAALFDDLADIREGKKSPSRDRLTTLFREYLREVQKLAMIADTWGG